MNSLENDTLLATVNPEGVTYSLRPAGIVSRALAYGIDQLITSLVLVVLAIVGAITGRDFSSWVYLLVLFIIQWFYHVAWEIFSHGSTPGKKIFGLRVVADDGSPVSPGASFIRSLLRFADTFLGLTIIGGCAIMFSPGFRRLGDWAGSTLVVYSRTATRMSLMSSSGRTAKIEMVSVSLKGEDKANIISFARRYDRFGKDRADEIASKIVPSLVEEKRLPESPGEFLLGVGAGLSGEGERR